MKRILVPLDGSPAAEVVLIQVRRLLTIEDAEVLLLGVIVPPVPGGRALVSDELRAEAEKYFISLARSLETEGVRVRWILERGSPVQMILKVALREQVSLIAMSTHGRTGLPRMVLGSVTEEVLRSSPVPILLVRAFRPMETKPLPSEIRFGKIMVPIDGSEHSLQIVPYVAELARKFASKVFLIHVFGPGEDRGAYLRGRLSLDEAVDRFVAAGVRAQSILEEGDPSVVIPEDARLYGADLIVMMTHGRTGLTRMMMGSVAEKVLRTARLPILVVRASAKKPRLAVAPATVGQKE